MALIDLSRPPTPSLRYSHVRPLQLGTINLVRFDEGLNVLQRMIRRIERLSLLDALFSEQLGDSFGGEQLGLSTAVVEGLHAEADVEGHGLGSWIEGYRRGRRREIGKEGR